MSQITIKTNNVPRPVIYGYELTEKERREFDYIPDDDIDSHSFIRYKGWVYDLGEFMRVDEDSALAGWHGYSSDSYFSGVVMKYADKSGEAVIMGRYCM